MGGHHTISIFNVCEDSLLASPLIIDLVLIAELFTRIQWREQGEREWKSFHSGAERAELHAQSAAHPSRHTRRQCVGEAAECAGEYYEGL